MRPRNSISIILQYFIKSHLTSLCKNNFFRNIVITKDKIVLWFLHPFNEFVLIQICSNSFESYSMQCLSGFGQGGVMIYQYTLEEKPLYPQFPLEFMRNTKIWKKQGIQA